MSKPLPRLHLRVAQDNPIYSIPAGQRNKKADEWLRIGSSTERLENAARNLEKLISQVGINGQISMMPEEPDIDKKKLQKDLKLIYSIMNMGGNKN